MSEQVHHRMDYVPSGVVGRESGNRKARGCPVRNRVIARYLGTIVATHRP